MCDFFLDYSQIKKPDQKSSYYAKVFHNVCGLIKEETSQAKPGHFGGRAKFSYKSLEYRLRIFHLGSMSCKYRNSKEKEQNEAIHF